MGILKIADVQKYVENNIGDFHLKRFESLKKLKLSKILDRKNPYLFKAKNTLTAHDLVKSLLDAHLSSQEETIFGEFLEKLSIFVCDRVYKGQKSTTEGIDLEFEKLSVRYIVSIKFGPNWGNSSQINKMKDNFRKAKRVLKINSIEQNIVAVNGCCYGRENQEDKGEYLKLCGQRFWEFISGNSNLYIEIIEPLGHKAKEKNEEFLEAYSKLINKFTADFSNEFCTDYVIDWKKLVEFNSGK
ncbi:MAG: PmeII family type II restriction endonuclease [Bacteroidota bacterium]